MAVSVKRVVAVTAGLMGIGAVCGGAIGAVLGVGMLLWSGGPNERGVWIGFPVYCAMIGGIAGTVLAPILAWVFLRRVPLGRAVAVTGLGALVGAAVSAIVAPPAFIAGALAGFVMSGIGLFVQTRRRKQIARAER